MASTVYPQANDYYCLQILVEETEARGGEASLANPRDAVQSLCQRPD